MSPAPLQPRRPNRAKVPALTRDLVRAVHPAPVTGGEAPTTLLTDDEIDALLERHYDEAGRPRELWVFAYGSLMWRPEIAVEEERVAAVSGWHRRFCLWQWRNRGSVEKPGLMLALERGGSCRGLALRLAGADLKDRLRILWRREMRNRVYQPRLVRARIRGGREIRALAFVADAEHRQFAGDLDIERTARLIARGVGERGPNIDYLSYTLAHMHELGVRDPHLDRILLAALALHSARRKSLRKIRQNPKR